MPDLLLAIEGGGTKTRLMLTTLDGSVIARETGGSASPLYIDQAGFAGDLRLRMSRIHAEAHAAGGQVRLAGLAAPMNVELVETILRETFGDIPIIRMGEGEIALGLFGLEWGLSLVAGTGSSCRALRQDGFCAHCGGYGPQFGDEGSGYWIGREAVAAAMRAFDHRGPETPLTGLICQALGLNGIHDILRRVDRSGHAPGPIIASLAPCVFTAAQQGDEPAQAICNAAGRHLANLVTDMTRIAAFTETPIPLVLTGGVFNGGPLILNPFERTLAENQIPAQLYPPAHEPSEGIIKLLQKHFLERK